MSLHGVAQAFPHVVFCWYFPVQIKTPVILRHTQSSSVVMCLMNQLAFTTPEGVPFFPPKFFITFIKLIIIKKKS